MNIVRLLSYSMDYAQAPRGGVMLVFFALLAACGGGSSPASVPQLNQAPVFTSEAEISVPEKSTTQIDVSAYDADGDPLVFSIVGGDDAEHFNIDGVSGALAFKAAPNFDAPTDSNANNIYLVTVAAFDGENTVWHNIAVSVVDTGLAVRVSPGNIKTLSFSWAPVSGVTYYKLYVNPDGISGYSPVGGVISATGIDLAIPAHLTNWVNSLYMVEGYDEQGLVYRSAPQHIATLMLDSIGYLKASNAEAGDWFGESVTLSGDGKTLAVGAQWESSAATGVNGDQADNSAVAAGAVYVFARVEAGWTQQAYIKASNAGTMDWFGGGNFTYGKNISLSSDGYTLAVGAVGESSGASSIDGDQADNAELNAGAVYVFKRLGASWTQHAYVKASNTGIADWFGASVALSADGQTLAVGAPIEGSAATGVNGDQMDNSATAAGAVYVFTQVEEAWLQQAYIKASNAEVADWFGQGLALSADGNTLAVGAPYERGAAAGVNGNQRDNSALDAGAVYVFSREDGVWRQEAYIKASNTGAGDRFGESSISLSDDGNILVVGAPGEDSRTADDQNNNDVENAGAVYVYQREAGLWVQQAYLKASNADVGVLNEFGISVALSGDGRALAVGARGEGGASIGVGGDQNERPAYGVGAVYVFTQTEDGWGQQAYVKAPNAEAGDWFGASVALSDDGVTLAVGAILESGAATGIGGDQQDNLAPLAGAVYLY